MFYGYYSLDNLHLSLLDSLIQGIQCAKHLVKNAWCWIDSNCYSLLVFVIAGRSRRGKIRGIPGSKNLTAALKGCDDPLFLDFLKRCLDWDPSARLTPSQALRHAWLRRKMVKDINEDTSQTIAKRASATRAALSKLQAGSSSAKARQVAAISEDVTFSTHTKLPQIGSTI